VKYPSTRQIGGLNSSDQQRGFYVAQHRICIARLKAFVPFAGFVGPAVFEDNIPLLLPFLPIFPDGTSPPDTGHHESIKSARTESAAKSDGNLPRFFASFSDR